MFIRENLYQYYSALDPNSHVNGSSTIQDISGRNEDASSQDITWRNYYWDFDVNSDDVSQIDFPSAGMTGNIIAQDWSWEIWFISSNLME